MVPTGLGRSVSSGSVSYFSADKLGSTDEIVACYFIDTHEGDSVHDGIGACSIVEVTEQVCPDNPVIANLDSDNTNYGYTTLGASCQIACLDGYWANEFAICRKWSLGYHYAMCRD